MSLTSMPSYVMPGGSSSKDNKRSYMQKQPTQLKNSYLKSGVNGFDPYCDGWTTAIETMGRV
jgi:hypothetical protein